MFINNISAQCVSKPGWMLESRTELTRKSSRALEARARVQRGLRWSWEIRRPGEMKSGGLGMRSILSWTLKESKCGISLLSTSSQPVPGMWGHLSSSCPSCLFFILLDQGPSLGVPNTWCRKGTFDVSRRVCLLKWS